MAKNNNLDFMYTALGEVCLSTKHMKEEDEKRISDLVEEIIEIFESYEENDENL